MCNYPAYRGLPKRLPALLAVCVATLGLAGCSTPSITAVDLDRQVKLDGIPYYLPKPYLIVAENIRYIPTPTVGLTQTAPIPNSFQSSGAAAAAAGGGGGGKNNTSTNTGPSPSGNKNTGGTSGGSNSTHGTGSQGTGGPSAGAAAAGSAPATGATDGSGGGAGGESSGGSTDGADKNASGNPPPSQQVLGPSSIAVVPAGSIPDGLQPEVFYTYQIVYLPDLTHRYGLQVKGGSGEMRTTLNLVNGWMFTGPGPLYLRDSFTGEKIQAGGSAASGILDSASAFVSSIYGGGASAAVKSVANATKLGQQGKEGQPATGGLDLTQAIAKYAVLHVYEPTVQGSAVTWKEVDNFPITFDRPVTGVDESGANQQQPQVGGDPTSTQIINAVKQQVTVQDGQSGGTFTMDTVTVGKAGVVNVVVGVKGNVPASPPYTDAQLKSLITQKVCGILTALKSTATCAVTVDTSKVQAALAKQSTP